MRKLILCLCILLYTNIAYASTYTVFYPENFEVKECDATDVYVLGKIGAVGTLRTKLTCTGIQEDRVKTYTEIIDLLPAPYTVNYVKGGIKNGIMLDD